MYPIFFSSGLHAAHKGAETGSSAKTSPDRKTQRTLHLHKMFPWVVRLAAEDGGLGQVNTLYGDINQVATQFSLYNQGKEDNNWSRRQEFGPNNLWRFWSDLW